ncbi:MAG: carboxypeptidase regulatory-like domain-containing protein, partial [Candidatus Cloacimonetes bacterium]|nr:carboxypeptidase regulatory-like domain-containing protein [Candidatus Cloacimonadota bacterium]
MLSQNNYTVQLLVDGEVAASQAGTSINYGESIDFTFAWTPTEIQTYELRGKVVLDNDENSTNDLTNVFNVTVHHTESVIIDIGNMYSNVASHYYPIGLGASNSLTQSLYMSDELNICGDITMLKLYGILLLNINATKPIKVWMANTDASTFTNSNDWLPYEDFTLVFDDYINLNNIVGHFELNIPLQTPFTYEGNNLCVMILRPFDEMQYGEIVIWKNTHTGNYPNRVIYLNTSSININPENPQTANARSTNIPNTTFYFTATNKASLIGNISSNGNPIPDVTVKDDFTMRTTKTDENGDYILKYLNPDTISITASKHGYIDTNIEDIILEAGETTVQDIVIEPLSTFRISGQIITNDTFAGIGNARIWLTGYEDYEGETDVSGTFTIDNVYENKTYALKIRAPGFYIHRQEIEFGNENLVLPSIILNELEIPPTGVVAEASQTEVELVWNEPFVGADIWLSYTNDDTHTGTYGANIPLTIEIAQRFTPAQLAARGVVGATLEQVHFMPHEMGAQYTLIIYTSTGSGAIKIPIHTQPITISAIDVWNEVELTNQVIIPAEKELLIAIKINSPSGYPACYDSGPAVSGYGDLFYYGGNWESFSDTMGIHSNWMIKGFVSNAVGPRTITNNNDKTSQLKNILQPDNNNNTRFVTGYNIWRTTLANAYNQAQWMPIATNVPEPQYTDHTWNEAATGIYKYGIKAIYTDGYLSHAALSNTVYKNMYSSVGITLATEDGEPASNALVTLTNANGNPAHVYTQIASSDSLFFPEVWRGIYSITVSRYSYETVIQDPVIITGIHYQHPTINLTLSQYTLYEDFDDLFPPVGWTIIDNDGDGRNWELWGYTMYSGTYSLISNSGTRSSGALYPDNWLITPQLLLKQDKAYALSYWLKAQAVINEGNYYSVMISTTNDDPESFTEIFSERITWNLWEQRIIDLPYAGEDIYLAIRHHNCTNNYLFIIDLIE